MSKLEQMASEALDSKLTPEFLLGLSDENLIGRATAARRRFGVCPSRYMNEIRRRRVIASDMVAECQKRRTEQELTVLLNRILYRTVKDPADAFRKIERALLCNELIDLQQKDLRPHTGSDDLDSIINVASSLGAARRMARAQVYARRRVTRLQEAASHLSHPYSSESSRPRRSFQKLDPYSPSQRRESPRRQPELFQK